MITNLELEKFSTFDKLNIDFSPSINIIIGENGTGKTQLLKAAYSLASLSFKNPKPENQKEQEKVFTEGFKRVFLPEELKIGKLSKCSESNCSIIKADFLENMHFDKKIKFNFSTRVQTLKLDTEYSTKDDLYSMEPIFIPTKEVLSLYTGLKNNPENKEVFKTIFDESYFDLCNQLSRDSKEEFEPRIEAFLEEIVNKIQGRFLFNDTVNFTSGKYVPYAQSTIEKDKSKEGTRYFDEDPTDKLSTHMIAEGFRKLGVLHRLIENETLVPKKSGTLFWDEPESNMNPVLMKIIVEVLLELSKREQQIVLTTHDYVFLKWFDLLSTKTDHIRYHVLYRDEENKIQKSSVDSFSAIDKNAIADTYSDLYDEDLKRALGDI